MTIKCTIKKGFPPFKELTPLYTGYDDGGTWDGFVNVNEEMRADIDMETGKPYGGFSKDELEALADFILLECPDWDKQKLIDNYWLVGEKKLDASSKEYLYLLEMISSRGSEPVAGALAILKANIERLSSPE